MEDKSIKDKALMWYFHPNEIVRLMRVRLLNEVPSNSNFTPLYNKNNIKFCAIINVDNFNPCLDMSLYFLIVINEIKKILIYNNGQNDLEKIQKLINYYNKNYNSNIEIYSTENKLWSKDEIGSISDQNCFVVGLQWAKEQKQDILFKISPYLIPCYRWIDDFKKLVFESDGITFSSYCFKKKYPFRSDLIGVNVNAWANDFVLNVLSWYVQNEFTIFQEFLYDQIAKILDHYNNSTKYEAWKKTNKHGFLTSGYVHWYDILGTNSYTNENRKNDKILWNKFKKDKDYFKISQEIFKNKYTLEDFKIIK